MVRRRELILAGALLPGAGRAAASYSAASSPTLVGAWSLIDAVTVDAEGRASPWLGREHGSGLIVYDASGMMSVQIASARKPLPQDVNFLTLPDEQRLPYLDTYYAYFGSYDFDLGSSTVTHFVAASLYPNEVGMTLKRTVALIGDVVSLTTPRFANGTKNVLRWSRMASPPASADQ